MNIDEIKARAEAATPGPWFHDNAILHCGLGFEIGRLIGNVFPDIFQRDKNADFIAHAREDIPYLLSELTAKDAEITRLRSLEPYLLSLQAEEWHKDAEEERACNKKLVAKINDMAKEKQALTALREAKERAKGCEYCNPDNIDYYYAGNVPNYCKHCGRELTKEAQG